MATGRLPDPNSAPVTAKGDLYTYSTVPAKLAVGNNGETLVADSSATTGLRWTAGNPQGNPVLNSAFQVWQRGTSIAVVSGSGSSYTADRWLCYRNASGSTVTRQVTNDTTNLPSIQYCARVQRDSGNTSTALIDLIQSFETINTIPFAGKTVTLSFYGRKGANFSSASDVLTFRLNTGTGTDQNPITSTYTGQATPVTGNATLTTTWQRFSATGTLSASANELFIEFYYTPSGTAGAADFFEMTGVQIDVGSVALPFRTYSATLAGEFAAACRYYWRVTPGSSSLFGNGISYNTTSSLISIPYPVPMRIRPTALEQTGTATDYKTLRANAAAFDNCTTVPTFDGGTSANVALVAVTSANVVSGNAALLFSGSAGSYLGWSAEL